MDPRGPQENLVLRVKDSWDSLAIKAFQVLWGPRVLPDLQVPLDQG